MYYYMVGKVKNKNKTNKKTPTTNLSSFASPTPAHIISSKPFGLIGMILFIDVKWGNMEVVLVELSSHLA